MCCRICDGCVSDFATDLEDGSSDSYNSVSNLGRHLDDGSSDMQRTCVGFVTTLGGWVVRYSTIVCRICDDTWRMGRRIFDVLGLFFEII